MFKYYLIFLENTIEINLIYLSPMFYGTMLKNYNINIKKIQNYIIINILNFLNILKNII